MLAPKCFVGGLLVRHDLPPPGTLNINFARAKPARVPKQSELEGAQMLLVLLLLLGCLVTTMRLLL